MKSSIVSCALAALLLLVSGCASGLQGEQLRTEPEFTEQLATKDDVFLAYGLPENIVKAGDDRIYYFVCGQGAGGGFGLRYAVLNALLLHRLHVVSCTVMVRIAPDGRVVSIEDLDSRASLNGSIWPWD